ncbi:hypothetical protein [Granulicella sibirica]|uniref:hypothetical protein n=1 Tax=Granulicella sibirica TaxID=2479048 RepID=UPI00100917E7|nr:hypothetical protein [Granulicella sibirica]
MPRVKVLKGVAHNLGSSFISLMNYTADDYSMGHILRFARESECSTLTIDLLHGTGNPAGLLQDPISDLPSRYLGMFHRLVESAGSDRSLIQTATLTLTYDLLSSQPSPIPSEPQSAYTCDVSIVDKRGKDYAARFDGWWFVERAEHNRLVTASNMKGSLERKPRSWRWPWIVLAVVLALGIGFVVWVFVLAHTFKNGI